jgi:hypoxia-inducible factor (prolyl hydroxylase)
MVTCYPHEARYVRHTDNSCRRGHGSRCIGYLNPPRPDGDGALRIYSSEGDLLTSPARLDIQPDLDRVLLFYSDDRVPHEVLPTDEPRFAVTVWYYDRIEAPNGLLANLTCLDDD